MKLCPELLSEDSPPGLQVVQIVHMHEVTTGAEEPGGFSVFGGTEEEPLSLDCTVSFDATLFYRRRIFPAA
mgnify:CR=1 FL=1